jgi:glycosyltransferase involved in cell wall biosynthesis
MKICFVVAIQNKGTILDRIAHEIGKGFDKSIYYYLVQGLETIPRADHYFVTHYSMLPIVMQQVNPQITPVTCFFTHDKGGLVNYVDAFNLCHSVIAESPEGENLLRSIGVSDELLCFVPEGGDNEMFKPHQRTDDGAILVCGTNYEDGRKNPVLINSVFDLISKKHKFEFLGTGWDVISPPYEVYPQEYARCSVYLSCSKLEGGGPNSLIEAMHSNLVPVVSDTGNARQYIQHGYNGFIFPLDATAEYVASLIERAYKFRPQDDFPFNDVWKTVGQFTWSNYAIQMKEIITGDYSKTTSHGEYAFKPA